VECYLAGGADPVKSNGVFYFMGLSQEFGMHEFNYNSFPLFDGDDNEWDNAVSQWTRFNIPGWFVGGTNVRAIYDDIYVATGQNARARVVIGNAQNYASCTKTALLIPNSWTNSSISAEFYPGEFQFGENAYLFVIDADGNVSDGFSITIGSVNSNIAIQAPSGLEIRENCTNGIDDDGDGLIDCDDPDCSSNSACN
jgi:hypothetical protein